MRKSIISALIILSAFNLTAQQLPFSSQYYANMFITNPAFTGSGENVNAFVTHRSQWTGVAGAPQTSYLTLDGPVEAKKIGLGLKLYSDVTDITGRTGAFITYAYRLKINEDNNIRFGLAVGALNNRIDFSKAIVKDANDPFLFTKSQSQTALSADFGLAYIWKTLEIGICIPQLGGNKIRYKTEDGDKSYYYLSRYYQGSIKYTFNVVKEKEITAYPLITLRAAAGAPVQYDINGVLDWKKIGWFGVTYHSNYAVALSAGVRYKNLCVGYAYDIGINKVKSYMGTTSEFLLGYVFGSIKKEEIPAETTAQTEEPKKDTAADAAVARLKAKTEANEFQIEILTSEIEQLKSAAAANPPQKNSENLTENLMRTNQSSDFVDENGTPVPPGFYIVVGTFTNKENAAKLKAANLTKGYHQTQMMLNTKTKVYYVTVFKGDKLEDAKAEVVKYKTEYHDVWVQKLE